MAVPRFIAQKVGDQYVMVPQQPSPAARPRNELWIFAATFAVMGVLQRGMFRLIFLSLAVATFGLAASCFGGDCDDHSGESKVRGFNRGPSFPHEGSPLRPVQAPQDAVEESSMESFPASDPPARMTPSQQS